MVKVFVADNHLIPRFYRVKGLVFSSAHPKGTKKYHKGYIKSKIKYTEVEVKRGREYIGSFFVNSRYVIASVHTRRKKQPDNTRTGDGCCSRAVSRRVETPLFNKYEIDLLADS
ncbi:MAG: hypothetical protein WC307_06205 [Candidatus Nanoarchaeia archaeon]